MTGNKVDGEGWARQGGRGDLYYVDVPANHPALKEHLDEIEHSTGRRDAKYLRMELPEQLSKQLRPHGSPKQQTVATQANPTPAPSNAQGESGKVGAPPAPSMSREDMHKAILKTNGARKFGFNPQLLAKLPEHAVKTIAAQLGIIPAEEAVGRHAAQVPAQTPQAKDTLTRAREWAGQMADRHADRVAAHFGIDRERAKAILAKAIVMVAEHAVKTGGQARGTVTIGGKKLNVGVKQKPQGETPAATPSEAPQGPSTASQPKRNAPPAPTTPKELAEDNRRGSLPPRGVRKAWDESEHPRDHGKFAEKPGARGEGEGEAGAKGSQAAGMKRWTKKNGDLDRKAAAEAIRSFADSLDEPPKVRRKVASALQRDFRLEVGETTEGFSGWLDALHEAAAGEYLDALDDAAAARAYDIDPRKGESAKDYYARLQSMGVDDLPTWDQLAADMTPPYTIDDLDAKDLSEEQAVQDARAEMELAVVKQWVSALRSHLTGEKPNPPKAGSAAIWDAYAAEADPQIKDYLASALHNAGVDNPEGRTHPPEDVDEAALAEQVAFMFDAAGRQGHSDAAKALRDVGGRVGLEFHGDVGESVPFDPLIHTSTSPLSTGESVRVERPAVTGPGERARTVHVKGTVEPVAKSSSATASA